jgi:hypothetical protein
MTHRTLSLAVLTLVAVLGGCERRETDNPDVAHDYHINKYNADIETGRYREETADQGIGVKPETQLAIDDRITNTYATDLRHCLEDEMDDHDTRFMRADFQVEFTIEPDGHTHNAHVLKLDLREQDAKGHDIGKVQPAHLDSCITSAVADWEFDPAPEVAFVDTYHGKLTEAY